MPCRQCHEYHRHSALRVPAFGDRAGGLYLEHAEGPVRYFTSRRAGDLCRRRGRAARGSRLGAPDAGHGRPLARCCRCIFRASRVPVHLLRHGVAGGGVDGRAHRLDQAARTGPARQRALAVLRPHSHHPPECRGLRLGANGRAGHRPVPAAPTAQDGAGGRALGGAGRGGVECGADCRHRQHWRGDFRWHGVARDSLAGGHPVRGGRRLRGRAAGADAGQPEGGSPLRVGLVHGLRAVLVPGAVPGGQRARCALRRGAGHHELVVRP
ncbi:hypothetical protein D3C72_1109520 [compost metagenome]